MKVIQKRVVRIKCDIYICITNGVAILATCKTYKKSLKQSEAVNRRRTNNAMAKRKRAIGQTTIYKTLHGKLMIEQHESKPFGFIAPEALCVLSLPIFRL
jgi:hypothetical protein